MTAPDWHHLAATKDSTEREFLSDEIFAGASERFVRTLLDEIDQEFHVLVTQARRLADAYWRFNRMTREEGGKENQGYFGTRVRVIKKTLSIEWFINTTYIDKESPDGKRKVNSDYISRGNKKGSWTYPPSAFRRAKDWEREAIEDLEPQYGVIRERAAKLTLLRREILKYVKLSGLSLTTEADDEVEEDAETTDAS